MAKTTSRSRKTSAPPEAIAAAEAGKTPPAASSARAGARTAKTRAKAPLVEAVPAESQSVESLPVEAPAVVEAAPRAESSARQAELERINAQLQQAVTALTDELKAEKLRLSDRISQLSRHVIVLNHSLIAQQQYAANVAAAAFQPAAEPIETDTLADMTWLMRRILKAGPLQAVKDFHAYSAIRKAAAFDSGFYREQLGARHLSPAELLRHYVTEGFRRRLDPSPRFNTAKYIEHYDDVAASGIEPYSHYLRFGAGEHRIALNSAAAPTTAMGDSIVRIYQAKDSPAMPPAETPEEPEERNTFNWIMRKTPDANRAALGLYDIRPEDEIPVEGKRGDDFMAQFGLLGTTPDYAGAVAHLNGMTPKAEIVRSDNAPVDVSIVIPVYGQLNYTLNCIHSLLQHASDYSFEILIGDDCSPDTSGEWLPKVERIRHVRHAVNGGFIDNCNRTAEHGRGRFMVMLNNDTRVVEGWLDWMIDSFTLFPKAGMVGSKLFYADGSLQEAGGIIWKDGSGWNYGRNDDPNRPRYCYARQVDYVSGCSIAVPTTLWREMQGFDPLYRPAYCEDVDLCFRLRAAGYETWFQPLSRIIHYEGKTSGTDTSQGVKAYQVTNMKKLFERWQATLVDHRDNAVEPWLERDRNVQKRVLVVDACNPTPLKDAGSVSIINLFRYYQKIGYQVSFVPEDNFLFQESEVRAMQATGVQCFYAPFELSMQKLLRRYGATFDIVHVIRANVANKLLDLLRTHTPHARIIYQNSDLHYLRMQRQAAVENQPELLNAAEAMKEKELHITRSFDVTIVHSTVEREILQKEVPGARVIVMPLIEKVVDTPAAYDGRRDMMFLGGYGHPPNVDAAHWLIDEIWPRLAKALPEARLLLVGANPPKSIQDKASDRIIVTGLVEDLAPWFARTRLFLAALRYGAGAKGKVLSSLAHGVPVVATDIAAEGLPLQDGKSVFMANTTDEIVSQAHRLYKSDEGQWNVHARNAKDYIVEHHGFDACVVLLQEAISTS